MMHPVCFSMQMTPASLECFASTYMYNKFFIVAYLQEDDYHKQDSDVRAQLKFFEQLDQLEKQRKEEQEREILLKAAKVQRNHICQTSKK